MTKTQNGISRVRLLLAVVGGGFSFLCGLLIFDAWSREEIPSFAEDFWSTTDAVRERGEYLARVGNCASCHTDGDSGFMAGGLSFETPFGVVHSTNITPDVETGIGSWTGAQFLRSMRHGVRANGEHLYPAFPYTAFTQISNADVAALFAYLKSVPAIRRANDTNQLQFPFNQRWLLPVWKALFFDDGVFQENNLESEEWNRGAYLVEALAHCSACHSPRNFLGAERSGLAYSGGEYIDRVRDGSMHPWSTPNLTSASNGLGMWSGDALVAYLGTGQNTIVDVFGPMNDVIQNSTRHLRETDLQAMAIYLKSLPPIEQKSGAAAKKQILGMGRTVYNLHCGTCHLPTGLGDIEQAPQLAHGSLVVQADNPAALINVILYGPELPLPRISTRRRNPMEEFQYLLTDEEVAAVASFVRSSWGNDRGVVTADQVARQR